MTEEGRMSSSESADQTAGQSNSADNRKRRAVISPSRRRYLLTTGVLGSAGLSGCLSSIVGEDNDGGGGGDGESSDPIKIGALAPLGSTLGQDLEAGTQMAVDQLNANGGINGRTVELDVRDSKNDPGVAQPEYTELTLEEEVDVTMGGWLGGVINVIMEGMQDSETLHICSGGASVQPNQMIADDYETYKYWFRVAENSWTSARNRFTFIQDNWEQYGWDRIGVIYEDLAYNVQQEEYFDEHFTEIGAENVMSTRYPADTADFTTLFDQAEENNVDMLYGVMAVGGSPAIEQWANQERSFQLCGVVSAAQQSSYYSDVDGSCRYFMPPISTVPGVEVTDLTVPFQESFYEQHGHYPLLTGYYGYMAVQAFATAAESAGSVNSDDLVTELENLEQKSLLGTLEFYDRGHQSVHDAIQDKDHIFWQFFQWQEQNGDGHQASVWPDEYANGEYQAPPWL